MTIAFKILLYLNLTNKIWSLVKFFLRKARQGAEAKMKKLIIYSVIFGLFLFGTQSAFAQEGAASGTGGEAGTEAGAAAGSAEAAGAAAATAGISTATIVAATVALAIAGVAVGASSGSGGSSSAPPPSGHGH
ncbi:MAG: hypothetical protein AB1461_17060 [Thermodesulfobacteriota bacterium]